MALLLVSLFVVGYALIAFEHPLKIDKAASALLAGTTCWLALVFGMASMPAWSDIAGMDAIPNTSASQQVVPASNAEAALSILRGCSNAMSA